MSNAIFASMRDQMKPSAQAREELMDRLAETTPQKKTNQTWRYVAVAACAALAVAAYPAYRALKPATPILHSYVTADFAESEDLTAIAEGAPVDGGGEEDAPNYTGVIDVPATAEEMEEAMTAYETLIASFNGAYPDWYGGAYLDPYAGLIVNVTSDVAQTAEKDFYFDIQKMAGSDRVGFGEVKYSLNHLRDLQTRADEKLHDLGVLAGSGVDERTGRLHVYLKEVNEDALAFLAELDPEDDAILVQVAVAGTDELAENKTATTDKGNLIAPGGSVDAEDGGEMPVFDQVDEDYVDDSELDLDAEEPADELPQSKGVEELPARLK